jgi:hypothetical protein
LPAPFGRQVRKARDSKAVRQTPIDGGFDKIGREESHDIVILTLRTLHPTRGNYEQDNH